MFHFRKNSLIIPILRIRGIIGTFKFKIIITMILVLMLFFRIECEPIQSILNSND